MSTDDEVSEGGSKIYRHESPADRPFQPAAMHGDALAAIEGHLKKYVGDPATVFHEIVSDTVHIDVHVVAPTPERRCYTLVTTGMSDLPMTVPEGAEEYRYAELLLSLPETWTPGPLWEATMGDEPTYWPVRLLKRLARLPHEYNTWLGHGHTIPNGDPPEPYVPDTELCCAMVMTPITFPEEFCTLTVRPDKTINFYAVVPLYLSEMHMKLKKGSDVLFEALLEASVTEIVDPRRRVAAKKKRFILF